MDNLSIHNFYKCINTYGKKYTHSYIENIVIFYPAINAMDELKSEEYYRQQCLQILFRTPIQNFYALRGNDLCDTWFTFFESQNLTIINTDLDYRNYTNLHVEEDELVEDCDVVSKLFF